MDSAVEIQRSESQADTGLVQYLRDDRNHAVDFGPNDTEMSLSARGIAGGGKHLEMTGQGVEGVAQLMGHCCRQLTQRRQALITFGHKPCFDEFVIRTLEFLGGFYNTPMKRLVEMPDFSEESIPVLPGSPARG